MIILVACIIDFNIDKQWVDRESYIVFEGVNSCLYLYVNDEFVGHSQGSHLAK